MTKIVRQLRSGQVTIPVDFRKQLGIEGDSLLQTTLVHVELRLKPVQARERGESAPWLKELYQRFAPLRTETASFGDDEINADIDRAIAAVRHTDA